MENGVEPTSNDQRPAVPLNNVLRADNGSEEVQSSIEIEKSSPTPIGSRKAYLISTLVVLTQLVQVSIVRLSPPYHLLITIKR